MGGVGGVGWLARGAPRSVSGFYVRISYLITGAGLCWKAMGLYPEMPYDDEDESPKTLNCVDLHKNALPW